MTPCIQTQERQLKSGYGYKWVRRGEEAHSVLSHRQAYADKVGVHPFDLPKDLVIRHKCDNPSCINPDHLEPGTHADNVQDKVSRGRQSKGADTKLAKLSEATVKSIINEYDGSWGQQTKLAKKYGVNQQTISKIISGEIWKHIGR